MSLMYIAPPVSEWHCWNCWNDINLIHLKHTHTHTHNFCRFFQTFRRQKKCFRRANISVFFSTCWAEEKLDNLFFNLVCLVWEMKRKRNTFIITGEIFGSNHYGSAVPEERFWCVLSICVMWKFFLHSHTRKSDGPGRSLILWSFEPQIVLEKQCRRPLFSK